MQQTGLDAEGKPTGIAISPSSETWSLIWQSAGGPHTPYAYPTPAVAVATGSAQPATRVPRARDSPGTKRQPSWQVRGNNTHTSIPCDGAQAACRATLRERQSAVYFWIGCVLTAQRWVEKKTRFADGKGEWRMNRPRGVFWSVASLLRVAAALALLMGLVPAPEVGAQSSIVLVDPGMLTVSEPNGQGTFTITLR